MTIHIPSLDTLPEAAATFVRHCIMPEGSPRVFLLEGAMGAGKTTFIAEVCRCLGVEDAVSSPTFAIVNDYLAMPSGQTVHHFDCYRLDDPSEALDMGAEDYFDSGNLCFVEWPDRIVPLLPPEAVTVRLTVNADGSRTLTTQTEQII